MSRSEDLNVYKALSTGDDEYFVVAESFANAVEVFDDEVGGTLKSLEETDVELVGSSLGHAMDFLSIAHNTHASFTNASNAHDLWCKNCRKGVSSRKNDKDKTEFYCNTCQEVVEVVWVYRKNPFEWARDELGVVLNDLEKLLG